MFEFTLDLLLKGLDRARGLNKHRLSIHIGGMRRYQMMMSDSALWTGFPFRDNDIVISPPAKCGTSWMQMLCALLVFNSTRFPRRLTELSPWLDNITYSFTETLAALQAQQHRRFIKTDTPLDGLPFVQGVTYLCLGRDPRVGIDLPASRIQELAAAATFDKVRERADELAPGVDSGLWRENRAFFHSGTSGQWKALLGPDDLARFHRRLAELASLTSSSGCTPVGCTGQGINRSYPSSSEPR